MKAAAHHRRTIAGSPKARQNHVLRRCTATDYYGIDIHKRHSVFTCLDERGRVGRRGRVANTAEELARAVAPSGGEAKAVLVAPSNWGYIYDVLEPWVGPSGLAALTSPLRRRRAKGSQNAACGHGQKRKAGVRLDNVAAFIDGKLQFMHPFPLLAIWAEHITWTR